MDEHSLKHKKEGRSRETLFRVAYQHQGQMIQVADYKANLIISISTMIISGIIALIGFGFASGTGEKYGYLLAVPVIVIVLSCVIALVFAIQAARPKFVYPNSRIKTENRSSLLFFRSIATYSQTEYLDRMKELLENEDEIYEQMTIDLYNQGIVLKRKYDLLRTAYTVLMYGFVASVIAFLVMMVVQP
ncbi:MAG TPA: Pycsar system effector family protein [Saprospiraceae bacterium]|nr:Pycsar system effector family protein [Saprospiraceae bacterium]